MFSLVSKSVSPVVPFVCLRENNISRASLGFCFGPEFGTDEARFFSAEPLGPVRLATAITAAFVAQKQAEDAVIALIPPQASSLEKQALGEAIVKAAGLARTGKVVSLGQDTKVTELGPVPKGEPIQGIPGGFYVGGEDKGYDDPSLDTGIFVMRADCFLLEAEILCEDLHDACQDAVLFGDAQSVASPEQLDLWREQTFIEDFWNRTENRARFIPSTSTEALDIPETVQKGQPQLRAVGS